MSNSWFQFKQFTIHQDRCAMKVTTDACLFGAWTAGQLAPDSAKGIPWGYRDGSLLQVLPKASASRRATGTAIGDILDIGTGTGLLSLMIAQKCDAKIDAIEIDKESCEQAIVNINASPWKERLFVIQGNAKDKTDTLSKQYDVIISNPPFYENELQSDDPQKNTAHHSTELSLKELISIIKTGILRPGGQFYLLLPYKRRQEIEKIVAQTDLTLTSKVLVRQSTRHDFFRIMLAGEKRSSPASVIAEELAIRDEKDQYTPEFIELLKDYYLYL